MEITDTWYKDGYIYYRLENGEVFRTQVEWSHYDRR